MVDGFEILIMAFVAPHLGAFVLSPQADRFGRRPMTIACLVVITIGMGLSAIAGGPIELLIYRGFAGLGIGGLVQSECVRKVCRREDF